MSGQTALAAARHCDDTRQITRLASGKDRPLGKHVAKSGKQTIRHKRACAYVGSGRWTSFPFHHGRTFIRVAIADSASKSAL